MMNFSILMSIYYKENPAFLNTCLNSIWTEQILKPTEIVLVRDGLLTPELDQVIFTWEEKLGTVLKIITLEQNIGLGKALNIGLTHCSYDWVFRMDSDDICMPNRFEKQAAYIGKHPEVSVLGGQVFEFKISLNQPMGGKSVPITHQEILKFAEERCPFNHMTVAYKKSVVDAVGGYQHHLGMEDYNLWLRVLAMGYESANLPDVLVYVRAGEGMLARRRGWRYVQSEWQLFQLKRTLRFQNLAEAWWVFALRSLPRLLPTRLLQYVYRYLRNNS